MTILTTLAIAAGLTAYGMVLERLPELLNSPAAGALARRRQRRLERRTIRRLERLLSAERIGANR